MTEPLAIVTGHESMVEAFRIAKEMRNLSNDFCDDAGDLADGQTDKVLGPSGTKKLGQVTIDEFCKMFAIKFLMVRDEQAEACVKDVWEGRQSSHVRTTPYRVSKTILERAKPKLLQEFGEKLAAAFGDDIDALLLGLKPETGIPASPCDSAKTDDDEKGVATTDTLGGPPDTAIIKSEPVPTARTPAPGRAHSRVVQTKRGGRF